MGANLLAIGLMGYALGRLANPLALTVVGGHVFVLRPRGIPLRQGSCYFISGKWASLLTSESATASLGKTTRN